MPFEAPFTFGPFAIDELGRISPRPGYTDSGLGFRWRNRTVRASFASKVSGRGRITLTTALGRIPSTAAVHADLDSRTRSLAGLRALPRLLPPGWRLRLLPDHRLRLEAECETDVPASVTTLVTDLTCFLLSLSPYLDLLDELGLQTAHR
jgi:hypothetical protein